MNCCTCMLLLCLLWGTHRAGGQVLEVDKSDWIDPTDMLNYDPSTKSMKKPRPAPAGDKENKLPPTDTKTLKEIPEAACPPCPVCSTLKELEEALRELEQCREKKTEEAKDTGTCQAPPAVDAHIYMRQYIRTLMGLIPLVPEGMREDMNIGITLTSEDIHLLERYTQEIGSIQDAHAVLTRMIQEVSLRDAGYGIVSRFERHTGIDPWTLSQLMLSVGVMCVGVWVLIRLRPSLLQVSCNLLLLMFLVSVPWNWWHLYKLELAKRHAEVIKDIPAECNPKQMGYTKSFAGIMRYWFSFSEDECTKYHQKLMVDPMWEVAPTKALAVTVTKFFVEPLEHIGEAISKFIQATLRDLPVQLWPVVVIIILVLLVLLLVLMCGYRVNLLGPLVGIEPGHRPIENVAPPPAQPALPQPALSHQEMQDNIHNSIQSGLQREISRLTETLGAQQQASIEAPAPAPRGPPPPQPDLPMVAMSTPYPATEPCQPLPPAYSLSVSSDTAVTSTPYPATELLCNLPESTQTSVEVCNGEQEEDQTDVAISKEEEDNPSEPHSRYTVQNVDRAAGSEQPLESTTSCDSSLGSAENITEVTFRHQQYLLQRATQASRMPEKPSSQPQKEKGQGDTDCKTDKTKEKDGELKSVGQGDVPGSSSAQSKTGNGETDSDDDFVQIEEIGHNISLD